MMIKLKSVDEYKEMRRRIRRGSSKLFTNITFFGNYLERYIQNGRALYQEFKNGFLLMLEEEKYYKLYLYTDAEQELSIEKMEKKVVFRYTYRKDNNEECPPYIEEWLSRNGFRKDGTSVYAHANVEDIYNKCLEIEPFVKKLEAKGFSYKQLEPGCYDAVEKMLISTEKIRDYQLECSGDEVIKTCYAIVDSKENLCAVCMWLPEGEGATVGNMVKDEYKKLGLAPMLTYYTNKWLRDNGIKQSYGWIYVDNQDSLNYQTKLGVKFENKYMDDWVLEV